MPVHTPCFLPQTHMLMSNESQYFFLSSSVTHVSHCMRFMLTFIQWKNVKKDAYSAGYPIQYTVIEHCHLKVSLQSLIPRPKTGHPQDSWKSTR